MERLRFMEQYGYLLIRWFVSLLSAFLGGVLAVINPTIPMLTIFTFAVLFDSFTAWRLARRIRRDNPKANDGKFKSRHFGRIFNTLLSVYFLAWLSNGMQTYIVTANVYLPNIVVGFAFGHQIWSILENISSYNDEPWAKFLQRFLVSKASRHFDYDFSKELEELVKEKAKQEQKKDEGA